MGEPVYNPEEVNKNFYKPPVQNVQPNGVYQPPTGAAPITPTNEAEQDDEVYNLQDASEEPPAFELLPKSKYECEVTSTKKTYSSTGKPMLEVVWRVIEPLEFQNRVIYLNITPSTKYGLAMLTQFIKRLGMAKSVDMLNFKIKPFADSGLAIGKVGILDVTIKDYKAKDGVTKPGNTVKEILPVGGQDFLVTNK